MPSRLAAKRTASAAVATASTAPSKEPAKKAALASEPVPIAALKESKARVTKEQIHKAVSALIAHHNRYIEGAAARAAKKAAKRKGKATNLLSDALAESDEKTEADAVFLVLTTQKVRTEAKHKPIRIPLAHPIVPASAPVCLITKESSDAFTSKHDMKSIRVNEVIGLGQLKKEYQPFEAKRKLCASFDLFLADDRLLPLLPPLLGKPFFLKKRLPAPVDLTLKDVAAEIEKARSATYLHLTEGHCFNIKVGWTNQTVTQLVENLVKAIAAVADKLPTRWNNILSLRVKTARSLALPLYVWQSTTPGGQNEDEDDEEEEEAEEADGAVEDEDEEWTPKALPKKRKASEDDAETPAPTSKRAKSGGAKGKSPKKKRPVKPSRKSADKK
ncbi:ribosomal protein L1p/L10e family-domain-containing protein [Zopfochytrium polystomum]|nr:ribosomal protein L1p/L10e family-domain-containing protein [Zopfochytrium polystomum]